jgi:hypothetical protein
MHTDTVQIQAEIETRDIAYIVSIFEMYENLAIVRTVDRQKGIIEFMIAPDFLDDARKLLNALAKEISVRVIKDPA